MKKNEIVVGYKATDKNMRCKGFQFELGVWHKHDGEIAMCESGFHFCEYPSGPWSFYPLSGTRIFKVKAMGVIKGDGPGADLKHVAMEIMLTEEILFSGDSNTGDRNTGDRNTGDRNTGNGNTGYSNTGNGNTGYSNTGDRNTGDRNTGNGNTGYSNTGDRNTGNGNTGDRNTGNGNCTDRCSGHLCMKVPQVIIFDKAVKSGVEVDIYLVNELADLMMSDEPIKDLSRFLSIPNATEKKIKTLHAAHIKRRSDEK